MGELPQEGRQRERNAPEHLLNSFKGSYHALEYMATKLRFQNIVGIEFGVSAGGRVRHLDVVVREVVNIGGRPTELRTAVELKNVLEGRPFPRPGEIGGDVIRALENAGYDPAETPLRAAVEQQVIVQLTSLLYVFRGNLRVADRAIVGLRKRVQNALPPALKHLASSVRVDLVIGTVPF